MRRQQPRRSADSQTGVALHAVYVATIAILFGAIHMSLGAGFPGSGDTDGDGVVDNFDLDDDNDGITDEDELSRQPALINPSFEQFDRSLALTTWGTPPLAAYALHQDDVAGWSTTPDFRIEVWDSGHGGVPAHDGNAFAEINAYVAGTLYQDFSTLAGDTLEWSIWHRGRLGTDSAHVLIGDATVPINALPVATVMTSANTAWVNYSGTYVVPAGQTTTRLAFQSISAAGGRSSLGNLIDGFDFELIGVDSDTDGDSISNRVDLDSDNDGIADIYEHGDATVAGYDIDGNGSIGPTEGFVDGNQNGLDDRVEAVYGTGMGVPPVDTSNTAGDSRADILDLDSDDDGIPDATEARASTDYTAYGPTTGSTGDSDNDGILDIYDSDGGASVGPGTFGSVAAGFKTGSRPPNADSDDTVDTLPDYLDLDSDGDGLSDAVESDSPAISGVSYSDPDGNIDDPLAASATSIGLENVDTDPADADYRSLNAEWTIDKATTSGPTEAGDTLIYTFTLTNTGGSVISNVAVADPKCAVAPALDNETVVADAILQVGETQTWSCESLPVTQDQADAGVVVNEVRASGDPAGGTLDDATDELSTPLQPTPSWLLAKSPLTAATQAGDRIDYQFLVTNSGNVTIFDVDVSDAKCASPPSLGSETAAQDGHLQVDETQIWFCTSIPVTQVEVDAGEAVNTASVTGTPAGGDLADANDDATSPIEANPRWQVIKAAAGTPTATGDTLDYTFSLVNTGNVTVGDVAPSDPKCAATPTLTSESLADDVDLQVGETQIWSCESIPVTQGELDAGRVDNSVTFTGTPAGGDLADATDDLTTPTAANPAWTLVKATSTIPHRAGDTLDYTFTVVNTGNVTITGVAVADAKCAAAPALISESVTGDSDLQVGETQIWSCQSTPITQTEVDTGETVNTAAATGTAAQGDLDDIESEHVAEIVAAPNRSFTKATQSMPTLAGETLTYTFMVVNTGNVTITDPEIIDDKCDTAPALDTESANADGVLQVTETQIWSCESIPVTQEEIDSGTVDNVASFSGTATRGDLDPVSSDVSTPIDGRPEWSVVKSTESDPRHVGDVLDYTFTVMNSGNVTISDVVVDDARCGAAPTLDTESITYDELLEPGESQQWSCTSQPITQRDVDSGTVVNTVTVTGTSAGGTLPPVSDTHTVSVEATPAVEVTKATASAPEQVGDTLDYTFTVANTGNVTITNVAVVDAKCANAPTRVDTAATVPPQLDPGETQTWACTSVPVTQAELDAGSVHNSVLVTGEAPDGTVVESQDHVVTPMPEKPTAETSDVTTGDDVPQIKSSVETAEELAFTGVSTWPLAWTALAAVLGGTILVLATRRRLRAAA